MLERKWPEKSNAGGHVRWSGRLYGRGLITPLLPRAWRVYYGTWGARPFQPLYAPAEGSRAGLALVPEACLVIAVLALATALSPLWSPLLAALPPLAVALGAIAGRAARAGRRAVLPTAGRSRADLRRLRCLTALLHVLQPLSRLRGRLTEGLTPWRPAPARSRPAPPPPPGQRRGS